MTVEFRFRDMKPADAHSIMQTMWGPGAAELERLAMARDADAMAAKFISIADYGWTFFAGDEMVAICGAQRCGDTHYTWFMATPELEKIGREFTMWLRRFCREAVEREGVKLEMFSASAHPNSDRWFAALGFERGDRDNGLYRHYRYTRKNKLTATK